MLFNSIEFALFLPVVFVIYWFVVNKNFKLQNAFLVLASYVFYGWWDWRFLFLIVFSSLVDYLVGIALSKQNHHLKRKLLLMISILVNIGVLGFFKYYNFFAESFSEAFTLFGRHFDVDRLKIILPVGISFYTFQTLSYSIDVYRKKMKATRDIVSFFAFVSFFPQLVAGPIERATNLLPQFFNKRYFSNHKAIDGMRQILWGLFKKIVIADNCATYVNDTFTNYTDYSGSTLTIGVILFAFQIYADFSGYSDIAIGTARLFGFNLMRNFANPYFARDIAEFWRRWHISLTTWFRDYVYIPLGGSRVGTQKTIRNIFVIFIVSGFWHGANWTFLFWGVLNAIYFLPLLLRKKNRNHLDIVARGRYLPSLRDALNMLFTFALTTLAWVFFRAENLSHAFNYLAGIFSFSLFSYPQILPKHLIAFILLVVLSEWLQRDKQHALQIGGIKIAVVRWGIYYLLIFLIIWFGGKETEFIYFQF